MANDEPTSVNEKGDQPKDEIENIKEKAETEAENGEDDTKKEGEDEAEAHSPDPYYPPIIYLPEIVVNSGEDGEEEIFKRRAKLYR